MQIILSPNHGDSGSPGNMISEGKTLDFYSQLSVGTTTSDIFTLSSL